MSGERREWRETLDISRLLVKRYPRQSFKVIALLVLGGIGEAVGIATLLPVLEQATGAANDTSGLGGVISEGLRSVGLEPTLAALLGLIVIAMTMKAVLELLAMRTAGYAAATVATDLRHELVGALLHARWEHFTDRPVGSMANAVATEALRASAFYNVLCNLTATVIRVVMYCTLAVWVAPLVSVGALVLGFVLFFALSYFVKASRLAGRQQTETLSSLTGRLTDGFTAIKPLKAMAREESLRPVLEQEVGALDDAQRLQVHSTTALPAYQEPIIVLFIAIGLYVGVERLGFDFRELMYVTFLFHRTITSVASLQIYYQKMVAPESAYRSISMAIDRANAAREHDRGTEAPALEQSIELRGVTFGYSEKAVLRDFSMQIPKGQLTAIIGSSGCGKTTIADLVTGLLEPQSGAVLIDGKPLHDHYNVRLWRRKIGYVPQETFLLNDTIEANVVLNASDVTSADVERALKEAEAWDFIQSMPKGIESRVGERGSQLSGGQRQRIALARALVRRPDLLILDEATTALDPATERAICETLRKLAGRVTILAISHQPAIVDVADVVVRLEPLPADDDRRALGTVEIPSV